MKRRPGLSAASARLEANTSVIAMAASKSLLMGVPLLEPLGEKPRICAGAARSRAVAGRVNNPCRPRELTVGLQPHPLVVVVGPPGKGVDFRGRMSASASGHRMAAQSLAELRLRI